jgi:beta-phosphoglucomutase-like phosphatase (HAD superfamily)
MKLSRKARAVAFDMDGLIFNTEALCRDAVMDLHEVRGLTRSELAA